jgi:hypothetical protein
MKPISGSRDFDGPAGISAASRHLFLTTSLEEGAWQYGSTGQLLRGSIAVDMVDRQVQMLWVLLFLILSAVSGSAQQSTSTPGEKARPNASNQSYNLPGGYTGKPNHLVKTVKVRAVVVDIDLNERTVRVARENSKQKFRIAVMKSPLEWGFVDEIDLVFFGQPEGMEKIKVGKKAIKAVGGKTIRLEDLGPGSLLKVEIYPVRNESEYRVAAREVTVEKFVR